MDDRYGKMFLFFLALAIVFSSVSDCLFVESSHASILKETSFKFLKEDNTRTVAEGKGAEQNNQQNIQQLPVLEKAVDPDKYILGPYDRLVINILSPEPRTFSLMILPEGYLFIPGVGGIYANGLTLNQFRERLAKEVDKFFHDVEVHCYLSVPRTFRVFVTGGVRNPGGVEVTSVERLSDAIDKAGGFKGGASKRLIRIERGNDTLTVDLVSFLNRGVDSGNPTLQGGDRIFVPPAKHRARILGDFYKAGIFEIIEGEKIEDLIDLAGGFTTDAITDSILLTRTNPEGSVVTRVVESGDYDKLLKDQDEITTFSKAKNKRRVYVSGAAKRTGLFYLADGEGLGDLLVRMGGFSSNADLERVYIEKIDGRKVEVDLTEYLPPHAEKTLRIDDSDVISIPFLDMNITVGGEVNVPGKYPYNGSWTVAQYIGLAGGPTSDGSINRVVIYSSDHKAKKANGSYKPRRGETIIVKTSRTRIFGEFFGGLIRLGTVVVSIIVLTK